ncbi:MAG: hypothetical protein ACHP9T_05805 [Caulobacterales bacterium]|jgi:hypothetical protein
MSPFPRLLSALILTAALAAPAARAEEPEAMATAPAATTGAPPVAAAPAGNAGAVSAPGVGGPSVADQIDNYLKTSPALTPPRDGASGVTSGEEPRKVHGVVDVAVGTNGYRSAFVQSELPVGKTGTLSIAVGESRFNDRFASRFGGPYAYAPGVRQSLGVGLYLGDAAPGQRCREDEEAGPNLGPESRFGGRLSPCRTAEGPIPPR